MSETKIIKLSANENCYGCSPLVLEAIEKKYKEVHFYPELNPVALKEKIAAKYKVSPKNVVIGAGSVRIIDGLIQSFVEKDEEVLTFEKSFVAYGQLAGFYNRKCVYAPLCKFICKPESILPLITEKTRIIFIANPNNPTGTIITHLELENFLNNISKNIIVVIDEAYAEFATDTSFPDSVELQKKFSNLVILRTFSKIYGLAGLRIGYALMNEKLAAQIIVKQVPFSLNYLASVAATAALQDVDFISHSAKTNAEQRDYLYRELKESGFNTIPSQANFIYLWFESDEEKIKIYDTLFQNGILICDMKIFGQEKSLRITVGSKEINEKIVSLISNV